MPFIQFQTSAGYCILYKIELLAFSSCDTSTCYIALPISMNAYTELSNTMDTMDLFELKNMNKKFLLN